MGFSEKLQIDGTGLESEGKKWVIAGISLRSQLKPVRLEKERDHSDVGGEVVVEEEEECSTTPTSEESRIPRKLACPAAPRKRKPISRCNGVSREFFNPPDLESVFICHVERAN